MMTAPAWLALAEEARAEIVDLATRLVQTPSLSGQEGEAARLVLAEMQRLGYDDAWMDRAGNVIGRIKGGTGRSVMLHAHLDIVDPGDPAPWRFGPYAGEVAEGYLWGRGTSDDKGCVAAQVMAGALVRRAGATPAGDLYIVAAVNEENGGLGTRLMLDELVPDIAIIGEPSSNTLRRAHRGRYEFVITLHGRSAHASAPERGRNPHFSMARTLLALREMPLFYEPLFGGSTIAPTLMYVDQTSANVIPATVTLHLDWRAAPGESVADAEARLRAVLAETVEPDIRAEVTLRTHQVRTHTGCEHRVSHDMGPFLTDMEAPVLCRAHSALEQALNRSVEVGVWAFCTDGGHIAAAGAACLGFGPGDEAMAHVLDERLSLDQLVEAAAGYAALGHCLGDS
jgi:putative selenium metabolism hydrolase